MQQISCPQCGAPVTFTSTASVMAVCGACRSTLVKDADSVSRIGEMSEVVEDYSPIQIGTTGKYASKRFDVVGRIQLRYADGYWNEWYLWFEDGTDGWLSDASAQYTVTLHRPPGRQMDVPPAFEAIRPGTPFKLDGQVFMASDKRVCRSVAGQGELPMIATGEWEARVADFRAVDAFLTLDYSDGAKPEVYFGRAVDLGIMQAGSLREEDRFDNSLVKYRGQIRALECPSCGAPVSFAAAVATHIVCPSCRAAFDCNGDTVTAVEKHAKVKSFVTTINLGESASIGGDLYQVIGLLKCEDPDPDEPSTWIEYLLYHRTAGFIWIVESDEGWDLVKVCDRWPTRVTDVRYQWGGASFDKLYDYESRVVVALGAFNWRVKQGDVTAITDFAKGQRKLTRETTADEMGWSSSTPATPAMLAEWFKRPELEKQARGRKRSPARGNTLAPTAMFASFALLFFNFENLFSPAILLVIMGMIFLWLPVFVVHLYNRNAR